MLLKPLLKRNRLLFKENYLHFLHLGNDIENILERNQHRFNIDSVYKNKKKLGIEIKSPVSYLFATVLYYSAVYCSTIGINIYIYSTAKRGFTTNKERKITSSNIECHALIQNPTRLVYTFCVCFGGFFSHFSGILFLLPPWN